MRRVLVVLLAMLGVLPASLLPVFVATARGPLNFPVTEAASLGMAIILSQALGALAIALFGVGRTRPMVWAGVLGMVTTVLLFADQGEPFTATQAIGSIAWAWSIPFVLGGCAALMPDRRDAVWLSFAGKLGLAVGPTLAGLTAADRGFDRAILLSGLLEVVGTTLFAQFQRRATGEGR